MVDDSQNTARVETRDDMSAEGDGSKETASSSINVNCSQTKKRSREYMKGRKKPAYKSFRDDSGNRFFLCHTCPYVTRDRKDIYKHVIAHVKTRDYQCEVCGATFKFVTLLNSHRRQHNEKVYPCSHCTKTFPDPRILRKHMKWHSEVRPKMCFHCGKTFVTSSDLKTHVRIHTGEKAFKCEECGRTFTDGSSWRRHKKTHIPAKIAFVCSKCNRHYARLDICNTHIKRAHAEFASGEIWAIKQDITEIESREEHAYTVPEGSKIKKTAKRGARVKINIQYEASDKT
ncbi:putative zinc finger protein 727 isoform X2 [Dreissena polymorpha]|uniref:C2H2-type domain-containing protein n=1 Tax=Dreissena polymorpha TaxID=45954 RepID=A0A9D3YFK4_DREPO|nr:putative zinc finger protein 727 isoform X2 [Dreissena polymorpha]KAH3699629.1 hypothetical protein DPMN_074588 [Dreissena polymorpha]